MLKIGLVKSGIQLLAGLGVGYIADNAISMVKPQHFTGVKKLTVKVGAFVLSAMAADKSYRVCEKVWGRNKCPD